MDNLQPNQAKTDGYVLDNRYRIVRVIGEGGFGITYEAVNIHSGIRVAIKENRQGDPQKFLREARTLRDFSSEPAIVSVLDWFEQDDSAYIVMEYLDGTPLSLAIRQDGKWPVEKAVRSFSPIMKALEHIHQAGVIHRDISPDNLMLMNDGSLILMDFGAAKEIHETNFTRTSIYKSVYSPPEQRETGITLGSYTDIYALCATFYFCITGQEPEDSLSRLLFDELKKPSECGTEIKPGSEKALLHGLELDSADRLQEVSELREQLEKDYPNLTEEEKKNRETAQNRRNRIILAICCLLSLLILGLLYKFRINILFTTIETQKVLLDSSQMPPEDFRSNADIVRERVKAFSGSRYLWKENEGRILFEVPSELFYDDDPDTIVRYLLTRPMVLSVFIKDEAEQWKNIGEFSQKTDIRSVNRHDDGLDVTFTKEAAKRFEGTLDNPGTEILLAFDVNAGYNSYGVYTTFTNGDGISVHMKSDDPNDRTKNFYWTPDQLKTLHLTAAPSTAEFGVHTEWKVRWEDVTSTLFPGKNQRNQSDIPGAAISIKYKYKPESVQDESSGYDLAKVSFQAALKNRLDSLDLPYAVGIDRYEDEIFVVKLPTERFWYEEAAYLTNITKINMCIGSSKTIKSYTNPDSIKIISGNDGTWQLEALFEYSLAKGKLEEIFQTLQQQDEKNIYLYFYNTPLFICSLDEAYASLKEDNVIRFSNWISIEYPEMNALTKHFGKLLEICFNQKLPYDANYEFISNAEFHDAKGNLITSDADINLPPSLTENKAVDDLITRWQDQYADNPIITYNGDVDSKILRIKILNADISNPSSALHEIESFMLDNAEALSGADFQSIYFYILPDNDPEIHWTSLIDPGKPLITFLLNMDFETGHFVFSEFGRLMIYHIENEEELYKAYNAWFEASPLWNKFLKPDPDKTIQ